jgi:hypothetical protein
VVECMLGRYEALESWISEPKTKVSERRPTQRHYVLCFYSHEMFYISKSIKKIGKRLPGSGDR